VGQAVSDLIQAGIVEPEFKVDFDFESFGVPKNFLELAGIDAQVFSLLSPADQIDLIFEYAE